MGSEVEDGSTVLDEDCTALELEDSKPELEILVSKVDSMKPVRDDSVLDGEGF